MKIEKKPYNKNKSIINFKKLDKNKQIIVSYLKKT